MCDLDELAWSRGVRLDSEVKVPALGAVVVVVEVVDVVMWG